MNKVENLFQAKASNLVATTMLLEEGRVGFVIPEYQRQYDWSEENINRLFHDMLNGLKRLEDGAGANTFTFLGTLILVKEQAKEDNFSGVSVAVVDGQQRLTTLLLFTCALCEALRHRRSDINSSIIGSKITKWLEGEIEERLFALYQCAIGALHVTPTQTFPFPRIVRRNDCRAKSKRDAEYKSAVARFLYDFADYFDSEHIKYELPDMGAGRDAVKLADNFKVVHKLVENLNNVDWYENTECEQFKVEAVKYKQCRDLFACLPDFIKDDGDKNRVIANIIKYPQLHDLIRTLMFSAYFCNCVVLTRVITEDEDAAFDIFDALNTTGEPLTALETLKPRVINFEETKSGYAGSDSEGFFESIERNINEQFTDTSRKQAETKEVVVTFALYLEGRKLSKHLAEQRNFLRVSYDRVARKDFISAQKFMRALAETAEFRKYYWQSGDISELALFHRNGSLDEVKLLISLLRAMKTSLALPIILRYWGTDLKHSGDRQFVEALKTIIAFLVIRRAATGGTAGIDSDFRAIMAPKTVNGAKRKSGLCMGDTLENKVLSLSELKSAFKTLLEHKLKRLDKSDWVESVIANPLYVQSKDLARFMILAAGHGAIPSTDNPGTWSREGVKVSKHQNQFLSYATWMDECCASVEHIAPDSEPDTEWAANLYRNNIIRNSIGNLTLLPKKENAAIGNGSWHKKKLFYLALTEESHDEQNERIKEAEDMGMKFSNYTIELLRKGNRLSILDPLRYVDQWNSEVVERRGRNIAGLCWDIVRPWLD